MNDLQRWHRDQQIQQLQNQSRYKPEPFKPAPKPDTNARMKSTVLLATFVIGGLMTAGAYQVAELIWGMWS